MAEVDGGAPPPLHVLAANLVRTTQRSRARIAVMAAAYSVALVVAHAFGGTFPIVLLVGLLGWPLLLRELRASDRGIDAALVASNTACPCGGRLRWQRRGSSVPRFWCLDCGTETLGAPRLVTLADWRAVAPFMARAAAIAAGVAVASVGAGIALRALLGGPARDGVFGLGMFALNGGVVLALASEQAGRFRDLGEALTAHVENPDAHTPD